MKFTLLKMTMMISIMSMMLKNPMSLGMMLLSQTMMIIMTMNKSLNSSWIPLITFLMMIGGLMILFIYMSSIASNEKFKLKINMTLIMFIMIMITEELMMEFQMNEDQNIMIKNNLEISMMKLYNEKSMKINLIMVMYLLLTMVSSSFIVKHKEGPLRQK